MTDIRQRFRDGAGIPASLVFLLAFAAGATVANIYYSQPLLNAIAGAFGTSVAATGVITVATQLGYATGLLLIVPLGDTFERRGLICTSILASAGVLLATAFSPTLPVLVALSYLLGLACVSPQLIVPYAATFAAPEKRGRVVGTVMGGLLVGILVSRSVSGVVGAHFGWQGMYFIGAVAMVLLATGLRWKLPPQPPHQPVRLRELLVSLWPILKGEPVLQRHLLIGAAGFGAFSVFWTTLSFYLAARPEHYGSEVTGLFGLIGVAGGAGSAGVGALVRPVFGAGGQRGVAGDDRDFVCDDGARGSYAGVAGRRGVFYGCRRAGEPDLQPESHLRAVPALRNRINAIYMVGYFIGGAIGSAAGSWALQHGGWAGVCFAGGGFGALGLAALFMPLGGGRREN